MPFDPKNKAHKKKLFPVFKALADLEPGKTPDLVLYEALGQTIPHGTDYVSNMRKGEIKASYAQTAYDWLTTRHFEMAHKFAADIFPQTIEMQWRKIVETRAKHGPLRLVPVKGSLGLVERDSKLDAVKQTILMGQRFYFELDTPEDGHAIVLQGVGNLWRAIDLGERGSSITKIATGTNCLPTLPDGQIDPLSESTHEGVHDFVAMVSKGDTIPESLEGLMTWTNKNTCSLLSAKVLFKK